VALDVIEQGNVPAFEPLSKFPSIRRDFAVVVNRDVSVGQLLESARKAAPAVVKAVQLFDVYTGENIDASSKSLALSLILQEFSHTLTDPEVDAAVPRYWQLLKNNLAPNFATNTTQGFTTWL